MPLVLCSLRKKIRAFSLKLPIPSTARNRIHQRNIIIRIKMNMCPNHIRRLRIRYNEFVVCGTESSVKERFVVVDFHGLAEEAFSNTYFFVVFLVYCFCESSCWCAYSDG